jgi:hypothetical protein
MFLASGIDVAKTWQSEVSLAATVIGLAGGVLTLGRAASAALTDRSLERSIRRHTEVIQTSLASLRQLQEAKETNQQVSLDSYHAQLVDDLSAAATGLERDRARVQRRSARSLEEPTGLWKWLLLYRPEGVAGWIVHSFFYGVIFLNSEILYRWIRFGDMPGQALTTSIRGLAANLLLAFYVWHVAVMHKHAAVLARQRHESNPNSDLAWWEKVLLWFPPPFAKTTPISTGESIRTFLDEPWAFIVQAFYFFLLFITGVLTVVLVKAKVETSSIALVIAVFLSASSVFAIHALSRRALGRLQPVESAARQVANGA